MNNKKYTGTKILILIPAVVFVLTAVCLGAMAVSYFSTGSDVTAVALIFTGTMSAIFTTVPCLVMAIFGTVFSARAQKEGIEELRKFHVMGIIEIIVYGVGVFGAVIAALFTVLAITG
ncbi:MAG: hypothetical protein J5518_10845 [Lachnospiraceae bacterium]|nr:hypothetical protein [Lachnospiraceae bacterium]